MSFAANRKEQLVKELKRLALLEAYNAIAFLVVYFLWIQQFHRPFSLLVFYPIFTCSVILLQGAAYWKICLSRVAKQQGKGIKPAKLFLVFRWFNLILLLLYPVILVLHWQYEVTGRILFSIGMYAFAWLEYINYYFIRLSYPVKDFFRRVAGLRFGKSQIAKEIERAKQNKI